MNNTRLKHTKITDTDTRVSATTELYHLDTRIQHVRLKNGSILVELTNIGAAITAIYTPDRHEVQKNIVAGYADLTQYWSNPDYFGVVVGRYANRIANGQFTLDGKEYKLSVNNGNNHLHGGKQGFSHKLWTLTELKQNDTQCSAVFAYFSADGEEGYPGNLDITVEYTLNDSGSLMIRYIATTDKSTPVNLTNHSYFNLTGFENPSVLDHTLMINAESYTEKNENNTPTGNILNTCNTALDFSTARKLGTGVYAFPEDLGYDHNFVLNTVGGDSLQKAAVLCEPTTGRTLTVYTTKPGMQLYTANYWNGNITGQQGVAYQQHGGVALETQSFPDSVNHPEFPSTILHPGDHYRSTTIFEFGIRD